METTHDPYRGMEKAWGGMRIGIDIGGTFTDFVIVDPEAGGLRTIKRLSTTPSPADAVIHELESLAPHHPRIVHGSTVATNALLERKGAVTALVTTRGFRDILTIGRQVRTSLYDLLSDRPDPVVPLERCYEVTERVDASGEVLVALNEKELPRLIKRLRDQRVESVALSLLFSFLHPAHEQAVAQGLRKAGLAVFPSSELVPEFREYERTSTVAINAYVSPILDRYLGELEARIPAGDFRIMQSNGGSFRIEAARHQGVRSILSGPAGGVVGATHVAKLAGFSRLITFDMGGTSTDVSLVHDQVRLTQDTTVGGLPIRVPVIDIHTVGAGGGSLGHLDVGGALRVGPQSAGSDPGPICYGRGGRQPTITDAHVALGHLPTDYFLGGTMPLESEAVLQAFEELASRARLAPKAATIPAHTAALGMIQIANTHMERALRVISIERGYDPRDCVLVSFGGAAGLHACNLAERLGIRRVLIPWLASVLSAYGMLAADIVLDYVQTVMAPGETSYRQLAKWTEPLMAKGWTEITAHGIEAGQVTILRELDMRYIGQSFELPVPLTPTFRETFHEVHEQRYGFSESSAPVEVVNLRIRVIGAVPSPPLPQAPVSSPDPSPAFWNQRSVRLESGQADVPCYRGDQLQPGHQLSGPAIAAYPDTTVWLPPRARASVDVYRNLLVEIG